MKLFNRDDALAKSNSRIILLEDRLKLALSKVDALIFENRELKLQVKDLTAKVEELTSANKSLVDENAQLKKRLKIDSSNSNLPSSTNLFKSPTVSNRDPSGKDSGGQPGHNGSTLKFLVNADEEVQHKPQSCQACSLELSDFKLIDTWQVHDIVITKKITNHYIYSGVCSCGCTTEFESKVPHGVSYGSTLKSALLYLHNKDLIPTERLTQTSADLFDMAISDGTIYNWQAEASGNLAPYVEEVQEKLLLAPTLHADESGMKVEKLSQWLHVVCNDDYTYYEVHKKRGMEAMEAIGILPKYTGNLVHDCFKSYHNLPKINQHGLCNAHLLRELKSMNQFYQLSFANKMRDLLIAMNKCVKENKLTYQISLQYKAEFAKLITLSETEAITLTNEKWQKDVLALANRLKEHGSKYLAFLDNPEINFTNNTAERDIRMIKIKQKISGRFRTATYATHFLRMRGFISTMRKQGKNILDSMSRIIDDPTDYDLSPCG